MQYLTKERYAELEEELKELKTEGRRRVVERLKWAKEFGDLSENSEYQEAREEQSYLERRIQELEEMLRLSVIISRSETPQSEVRIGSKVRLSRDGKEVEYTIVGSNEARPQEGFISNVSPIGKALLNKKPGEKVVIQTPKGEIEYEVVAVE